MMPPKVIALPDTRYTSLCIEKMVCSKCDSGVDACKNYFHAFHRNMLASYNFVRNSHSHNDLERYKFGAIAEQGGIYTMLS